MSEKQAALLATLESSVLPDDLQVRRIVGREAIGELFDLCIDVVYQVAPQDDGVDAASLLQEGVTLTWLRGGVQVRQVHGVIVAVEEHLATSDDARMLRLIVGPRAHRLTLVHTQDLYFDLSVPDLIAHKLERVRLGASDAQMTSLLGKYPVRDFIVQYEESDLAFISRLAEHVGLTFYFDHEGDDDRMVFTDHNDGFEKVETTELVVDPRSDEPGIFELVRSRRSIPKRYAVMDYNYRTPEVELTQMALADSGQAGGVVEYGGHFKTPDEGNALAKVRSEQAASESCRFAGKSGLCEMSAGHRYAFGGGGGFEAEDWLIVEVEHDYRAQVGIHGGDGEAEYENRFVATPASVPFRPARQTPCPKIHGLVHGVVEPEVWGKVSTRAKMDDKGRYWIKFLFDTAAVGERKASKPVRIALPNAGPDVGMQFPLRPGVEVVMGFIGGDPDRPIILGALHNVTQRAMVDSHNSDHAIIRTGPGAQMKFKGGH